MPEPYRSHDRALVPANTASKAEYKWMMMTGVIILPPWQRNALVEGPEPLYQHGIPQDSVNKYIFEFILNIKGIMQKNTIPVRYR